MNRHGGIRREGVIDYSVNINPLGMPEWVKDKVLRILDEAHTYPEILAEEAVESLASHLKSCRKILLGNGATELLPSCQNTCAGTSCHHRTDIQ